MSNHDHRQPNIPPRDKGELVRWLPKDSQLVCRVCGEDCKCDKAFVYLTDVLCYRQSPKVRTQEETSW